MASGVLLLLALVGHATACSNLLVSSGASLEGPIYAYNADETSLFGSLSYYPAADHPPGSMRQTWDWDSSIYLGEIPEVNHTYNVVGNVNEWGLMIGETTFGGLPQLGHLIDYGSLIWITLQRAKTAREAILLMDSLCAEYGYGSNGESFAVADTKEIWLMELMSKGADKGILWVATRVPDGYVTATANQARTRTFNQSDPENVMFAKDVVTYAQAHGLYPSDAPAEEFSFSDVYDPVTFGGARFGEARVWSLLNPISNGALNQYLDYAQGYNLTNRMPLMVQASKRLAVRDVMHLMRTHNEGTWFDNTGLLRPDVGAESGYSPYRTRPLTWTYDGKTYLNERTVGTQQTGWNFVAHSRAWVPAPIAALMYWSPDDSSTSPRIPVYGGTTRIPPAFGDVRGQLPGAGVPYGSTADSYTMTLDSAFWIWNLVGNLFQGHHNLELKPLLLQALNKYESDFFNKTAIADREFEQLYSDNPAEAIDYITGFVVTEGQGMFQNWMAFWMSLFSRIRDGGIITAPALPTCEDGQTTGCTARPIPTVNDAGYDNEWYGRIVAENGPHYAVPASALDSPLAAQKMGVVQGKQTKPRV